MTYTDNPKRGTLICRNRAVYFLQGVESRLIKIGVANDAAHRLRELSMSSPDRLRIIGLEICARRGVREKELHKQFAAHRKHGEWFSPAEEIIEYADTWAHFHLNRMVELQRVLDCPTGVQKSNRKASGVLHLASRAHREKVHEIMRAWQERYDARLGSRERVPNLLER
jgi:hypothetical protein